MDMTAIYTGAAAVSATVLGAIAHARTLYTKIKPMFDVLVAIGDHIKKNQPGVLQEIAADIEQATTTQDQNTRELLIKWAAQTALHALSVEMSALTPTEKFVIADFVQSRLPEQWRGQLSLEQIDSVLQLIADEIAAANEHDGIKAVLAVGKWVSAGQTYEAPENAKTPA